MAHPRAKLTPFGRRLLVERVTVLGWRVSAAAESLGVSRATAYEWLRRYREEGEAGLEDRPSRPRRCPRALPLRKVRRILRARARLRRGPHRLAATLGMPRSTIYGALRRHGPSRLREADRTCGAPVRYQARFPGALLHLDVKKLGRIPDGGGWRMLGRAAGTRRRRGAGYDYVHVAVGDATRVAYAEIHPDERGETAARFLVSVAASFAELGVRIGQVMTDRAFCYTAPGAFAEALAAIGARHKPTRPYRPQENGKAERFIGTMISEWAYARLYRSNEERRRALPRWLYTYDHRRPHTALGGLPPMVVLVNKVGGNDT
jgi:transposase InsO family protein